MPHYLLDTHHAIALWRNHPAIVARATAHAADAVHLCRPVVGDMWYRIYNMPNPPESERTLVTFLDRYPILEYDAAAAVEFGLVKTSMLKIRRPISDVDSQTAAIARLHEMTVLTADQHFAAIPRLRVENWLTVPAPAAHP